MNRPNQNTTMCRILFGIIGIFVALFVLAGLASAQYQVQVKPMRLEFTPLAGRRVEQVLQLRNRDPNTPQTIDLALHELGQYENGNWQIIEPNENSDASKGHSCLSWVKLDAKTITLLPQTMVPVTVTLHVPPGVRGFYCACLTASIRPPMVVGETPAAIVVRFLVPILVQIQGQPTRQSIQLTDVAMEFRPQSLLQPATTIVSMQIANMGGTYSHLKPKLRLQSFSGGHWRTVTEPEFKEVSIIPEIELSLKGDIERSLPPGKYKLYGELHVDGRRVKPVEKEIEFAGDPSISKIAYDAALDLWPADLSLSGVPGATRTAAIRVDNTSASAVEVTAALTVPPVLKGVAFGELKGEDLICTDWVQIVPDRFTLRGGRRQNIRVVAKIPNADLTQACYYAVLALRASYPDGRSAGTTTSTICVANKRIEAQPAAQPMRLTLAAEEGSNYVVSARFGNVGNIHFVPRCSASIVGASGPGTQALLAGKGGVMLPLEVRDFAGVLDFSRVGAGMYRVNATLEYAPSRVVAKDLPIQVSIQAGQPVVQVIE